MINCGIFVWVLQVVNTMFGSESIVLDVHVLPFLIS